MTQVGCARINVVLDLIAIYQLQMHSWCALAKHLLKITIKVLCSFLSFFFAGNVQLRLGFYRRKTHCPLCVNFSLKFVQDNPYKFMRQVLHINTKFFMSAKSDIWQCEQNAKLILNKTLKAVSNSFSLKCCESYLCPECLYQNIIFIVVLRPKLGIRKRWPISRTCNFRILS